MEDVIKSGTGTAAAIANQPVAGKTGTTNADGDIWFCGYTPYYTASIWIGFDDNTTMKTSNYKHREIWSKIMTQIHQRLQTKDFPSVDNIVQLSDVCSQSGKLAVDDLCDADPRGSQVISEYFAEDNQPKDTCDTHVRVNVCDLSGMAASSFCPATSSQIFIRKPSSSILNEEDAAEYPVGDAEYTITDSYLSNLCTMHNKAVTVMPGVSQGTTGVTSPTQSAVSGSRPGAATGSSGNSKSTVAAGSTGSGSSGSNSSNNSPVSRTNR